MIDEAICNALYILRKRSIETRDVSDQHRLVVLSAPCEHRCHERNAEASTLIAEEVGEARRFVVFVLGQIGVGELAGKNKTKEEVESVGKGELSFPEQPQFNHRVLLAQFPNHCHDQSNDCDGEECHDEIALKPVQPLTTIEHDFEARRSRARSTKFPGS